MTWKVSSLGNRVVTTKLRLKKDIKDIKNKLVKEKSKQKKLKVNIEMI